MKYLDSNIIVYAIENHPKYGKACRKILLDIQNGELKVTCSVLVLIEILNALIKINKILKDQNKGKLNIRENIDAILSYPIVWMDLEISIIRKSSDYDFKISGLDYIHLATMELNSVSEIISADKELDKIHFIKRIDPISY